MLIATWNLNNRVGKVRFRPEAASAAIALGADVLVFNEYYPKDHEPPLFELSVTQDGITKRNQRTPVKKQIGY